MRICIANATWRHVGGTETYVGRIAEHIEAFGHSIAAWHEHDAPASRARLPLPPGAPAFCVAELGSTGALDGLRSWAPDVIYVNRLEAPEHEAALQRIAPAVLSAHDYHGTCISGSKTLAFPTLQACDKRFGAACLAHYFPRRCGGSSPATMLRLYSLQARRLSVLRGYAAVVVHSEHMRREYGRHGIRAERVALPRSAPSVLPAGQPRRLPRASGEARLLFAGRIDRLKGGKLLLEALPRAAHRLGLALRLRVAGDGPDRARWEALARRITGPSVSVEFVGWVSSAAMDDLYADTDLLVVPSVWPEPFGLIGIEAGLRAVPVAAFAVGGVPEWLRDGINGFLAPADPPTSEGLASAITRCLEDDARLARLREGAREAALTHPDGSDLSALLKVLERAAGRAPATGIGNA